MKNFFIFALPLFLVMFIQDISAYSFDDTAKLDKRIIGIYKTKSEGKMLFLRDENTKVKKINNTNFIEIEFGNSLVLYKYTLKYGVLILYNVQPKSSMLDFEIVDTLCNAIDFDSTYLCENAQFRHVIAEEKKGRKNYQKAIQDYLFRFGESFDTEVDALTIKNLSVDLPSSIRNTAETTATLIYKNFNSLQVDYQYSKESLWFLSLGDNSVNIYINGLDFRDGTPSNSARHDLHKEDWKPYYKSNVLSSDYNIIYSWDSSEGITKKNTQQLEKIIKFIFKNNPNNPIKVIAHSHGGNLAKQVLVNLAQVNINMQNIRLVTLATPHKGIKEIDSTTKIFVPMAEIIYDMFSFDFDKHEQVIQAGKRLYSGAYDQLKKYKDNGYLQELNKEYLLFKLEEQTTFIAGRNDKIVNEDSSLFLDVGGVKKHVDNSHSNIVNSPDKEIFTIISQIK